MKNIAEVREALSQIQQACFQIGKGCEDAQHEEIGPDDLEQLVLACRELSKQAEAAQKLSTEDLTANPPPSDPFIPSPREELLGDLRACGYDASFHEKTGQIRIFLNGHWFKVAGGTAPHPTLIEVPVTEL